MSSPPFSYSQSPKTGLSECTQNYCSQLQAFLSQYNSFKVTTGPGTALIKKPDASRFEREGCRVSLEGPLPKEENEVPNMDQYFKENNWEPLLMYQADGHRSGSMGFFMTGEHSTGTFCLEGHNYNVSEGGIPTYLNLDVVCTDGRKEVFIK
jgi:hypothetical protein